MNDFVLSTSCASQSTEEGVRAVQDMEVVVSAVADPGRVEAGCCRVVALNSQRLVT